jgi:hypothetical protein
MKRQIEELRKVSFEFHIFLESIGIGFLVEEAAGDNRSTSFGQGIPDGSTKGRKGQTVAQLGRPVLA